jgi:archaetidylinositol phosphate synthase
MLAATCGLLVGPALRAAHPIVHAVTKPWDSRLANLLVRPLRGTAVHPNHITTVNFAIGLGAAGSYAWGHANLGAALYVASAILDHADGELARMTGKTSAFGAAYDRATDLVVKIALFAGMGFGFRHGALGGWAILAGLTAGVAFVTIFLLRSELSRRDPKAAMTQPAAGGFELEDILYVIAPLTWAGALMPFVLAAAVGAPLFALWTARQLWTGPSPRAAETPPALP